MFVWSPVKEDKIDVAALKKKIQLAQVCFYFDVYLCLCYCLHRFLLSLFTVLETVFVFCLCSA